MNTQGSQGGGEDDPQTLGEIRRKLIKDIKEAEKLGARPEELATIKSGLKHIEELIRSLRANADQ
jgi:hypothetical protein